MSLGEVRVQQRWWGPLKQLNHTFEAWATHPVGPQEDGRGADASGFLQSQLALQQEEAAWRSSWANILQQEQLRS
jgi:hypothetical protein